MYLLVSQPQTTPLHRHDASSLLTFLNSKEKVWASQFGDTTVLGSRQQSFQVTCQTVLTVISLPIEEEMRRIPPAVFSMRRARSGMLLRTS